MNQEPIFLSSGLNVGRYRIERVLGYGENGIAYLALDKDLNRNVVLKEHYPLALCTRNPVTRYLEPLDEETECILGYSVSQFINEARLIASLEHPSIIKIHRVFSLSSTTCFYVMPLLEGGTMQEVIRSGKRIPPKTIISWLQGLVSALDCLNRHNIVHLDIKPGNILLTKEGQPVLADFGTASLHTPHGTGTVNVLAYSAYSAPELFTEEASPDIRADQYSLAACFYELMTNCPWKSTSKKIGESNALALLDSLSKKERHLRGAAHFLIQNLSRERNARSPSPDVWLTGLNQFLHRYRIQKLRRRILVIAGATLIVGGTVTWGFYKTGILTQEKVKTPEDLLAEKLAQADEIVTFNRSSQDFHDYYRRMFLNLAKKKETAAMQTLSAITATKTVDELEQIRQEWHKKQQFDNMTLLAAERIYSIKAKGLSQQYQQLASPAWFQQWKQSHPDSKSSGISQSLPQTLLQRIFPHPFHNPSYISESRLRINTSSSKIGHALEKKAQEFGIYKTAYPNGMPRDPSVSKKTDFESSPENDSFKLMR